MNSTIALRQRFRFVLAALLIFPFGSVQSETGWVDWQGWTFAYSTDNAAAGLVLSDVSFNDQKIIHRASFPVMRVEYENDDCGPFADVLWNDTYLPIDASPPAQQCNGSSLCQRSYEQNGEPFLELGINARLGEYEIYQSYVFSPEGYFDSLVFSRGLQCNVNHTHHAHWLFDFDIGDAKNDQFYRNTGDLQSSEFNDRRADTQFWSVLDAITGKRVEIIPSRNDGFGSEFSPWDVAVRKWKSAETGNWHWGTRGEIGELFFEAENIDREDIVMWYISHLQHSALEGDKTWHFSGPRIKLVR